MKTAITVFLASTWLLAGFGVVSLVPLSLQLAHDVSQWEKANGYPYGRMCNSIFTLYVDTCR